MNREWPTLLAFAAALLIGLYLWPHSPDTMPVHWGANGQPDRYGSRLEGLFVVPAVMLTVALVTWVSGRASQTGARNAVVLRTTRLALALLALLLQVRLLLDADVPRTATIGLGLTFLLIGNVLGKAEPDTRRAATWTTARRGRWYVATRRTASRLFAFGLLLLLAGLLTPQPILVPWIAPYGMLTILIGLSVWSLREQHGTPAT